MIRKNWFAVVCVLLAATVTQAGNGVGAGANCAPVSWEGTLVQPVPGATTEGDVDITIDGLLDTAHMSVVILRAKPTEDGTQETDWGVVFDLGDGNTFGGVFHGVLSPESPGVFRANAQGKITEGFGEFADTFGKIVVHGTFEVTGDPWAVFVGGGRGRLCSM